MNNNKNYQTKTKVKNGGVTHDTNNTRQPDIGDELNRYPCHYRLIYFLVQFIRCDART